MVIFHGKLLNNQRVYILRIGHKGIRWLHTNKMTKQFVVHWVH